MVYGMANTFQLPLSALQLCFSSTSSSSTRSGAMCTATTTSICWYELSQAPAEPDLECCAYQQPAASTSISKVKLPHHQVVGTVLNCYNPHLPASAQSSSSVIKLWALCSTATTSICRHQRSGAPAASHFRLWVGVFEHNNQNEGRKEKKE